MGRFSDGDYDGEWAALDYGRWKINSERVLNGKPSQKHFRALEAALLAMPTNNRRLIEGNVCKRGQTCAIGEMAVYRLKQLGVPRRRAMKHVEAEVEFPDWVHANPTSGETAEFAEKRLGMTFTLGWLIAEANDVEFERMTPEQRWRAMLEWTRQHIRPELVETT